MALVWQEARAYPGLVTIPVLLLGWHLVNKKRYSGESSGGWNFSVNPRRGKSSLVCWEGLCFVLSLLLTFFAHFFPVSAIPEIILISILTMLLHEAV